MKKNTTSFAITAAIAGALCLSSAEAVTFSANTAMKANMTQGTPTNPYTDAQGGVWTYAQSAAVAGGAVSLLNQRNDADAVCLGFKSPDGDQPVMHVNTGTEDVPASIFGSPVAPGEIVIHPAHNDVSNHFGILRFTVPKAGTYNVAATFRDANAGGGDGVDVHVVVSGHEVDHAYVHNPGTLPSYTANVRWVPLAAGDTVDFVVGP